MRHPRPLLTTPAGRRAIRLLRALPLLGAAACAGGAALPPAAPLPVPVPGPAPGTRAALPVFVDSLIDVPEFRSAHWGILVVDPGRGETLYSRNADKLFLPASNMKLVTGATAVTQLGLGYQWRTVVAARGPVHDGTLEGDLVVRGSGDPSVSTHVRGDALAPLRAIADSLRQHGITRIRGSVTAAPSPFTDDPLGFGWSWSDLDEPYAAGVDALFFNEGFTEIVVHGGARAGDPVRARTQPLSGFPPLLVRARTVAPLPSGAGASDSAAARPRITVGQDSSRAGVLVTGTLAAGDSTVVAITFRDQQAAYLAALRTALRERGIAIGGEPAAAEATTGRTGSAGDSLFTLLSPTLGAVLPFFEKPSQNQIGELLFKTLALEKTGAGRADSAAQVVSRQLLAWGIPADGFVVRDGSGLSRHDYLSPRTLVRILDVMRTSAEFRAFYDALPVAGVDGTLRSRMKGTRAEGNLHAKTGTLDRARSLSGFVTTADGRLLLFSALCNNYTVPTRRVDRVTDALGAYLASLRLQDR